MAGIFPNPSASATNFKVGDKVKWFISEKSISPYIGVVTHTCPKTNKVWVEFPIGGNQQKDPSELILAPITENTTIKEDTGYDSYEKIKSEKEYGTLDKDKNKIRKMASEVAKNFRENVVSKVASDIINCLENDKTDIQAYYLLYPKYKNICSDKFIKYAISEIYKIMR